MGGDFGMGRITRMMPLGRILHTFLQFDGKSEILKILEINILDVKPT